MLTRRRHHKFKFNPIFPRLEKGILTISGALGIATNICAVACLVALTVYEGYTLSKGDVHVIRLALRGCQGVFIAGVLFNWIFRMRASIKSSRIVRWIVEAALLVTLLPWIYPKPHHSWLPWLDTFLYSNKFLFIVMGAFSIVRIFYALAQIPSRRTNPAMLMGASFLVFIIIGSFMLMLPRCTYHGISYFDSLFVASSAVCITGLCPVDFPTTFTPFGTLVVSVLVQLGSLGIITFTSFFAVFFTGATSIYNQLLLKDIIYSKSMNSLIPTLLYVLGFTIAVELIGAFCIYFTVPEALAMDTHRRIVFSLFHSMSSFCNAGFSCLPGGMSNHALMHSNQSIYLVTSALIFAGAVGFPTLVNLRETLFFYVRKAWAKIRGKRHEMMPLHIYDLNTKIVLCTTIAILVVSTVLFFIFERHNTLQGMTTYEKWVQSLFNSLIPRSAGFASVNPAMFLDVTLFIVVVQMIIGGASQSMAGGIKVNTLGAILLNLRSILLGHKGVSAFNRSIAVASIRRANAVITLATVSLTFYIVLEMLLEPDIPTKSLVFETVSALFTVGSSLGATNMLSDASKVVLCTAMFFGRIGLLSFLAGVMMKTRDVSEHLPKDTLIIN